MRLRLPGSTSTYPKAINQSGQVAGGTATTSGLGVGFLETTTGLTGLGTLALIDTANSKTVATRGREAATSLARQLIEDVNNIPFRELSQTGVVADLHDQEFDFVRLHLVREDLVQRLRVGVRKLLGVDVFA